jgi:hypothetical protein
MAFTLWPISRAKSSDGERGGVGSIGWGSFTVI